MSVVAIYSVFARIRLPEPLTTSPDFAPVVLFSLLGLSLTAALLSCAPEQSIRMMFSPIG